MRRTILLSGLLSLAVHLHAQTHVTLVGTGGPELTRERAGESTLVESRGQYLLFDAGRGVLDGLYRSRVRPQEVTRIFLTHLHSDHIEGLPGLWITPWFLLGRKAPIEVWGPAGTAAMIDGMRRMFAHDIEHRSNAVFRRESLDIVVHEVAPGTVYDRDGIRVVAIAVEHADGDPAFAYRVETGDARILMTGDCTYGEGLLAGIGRLDLVISNVAAGTPALEAMPRWRPVFAKLMRPEQAAVLFEKTAPRLAVYSHIVKKGLPGEAGDALVLGRTRAAGYRGPLRMGSDQMRITLGPAIGIERLHGPIPDFDSPEAHF